MSIWGMPNVLDGDYKEKKRTPSWVGAGEGVDLGGIRAVGEYDDMYYIKFSEN